MNKLKVYLASGWFTPNTREILDTLESKFTDHSIVDLYSPRRDGIMLPPNQRHDTELRESIFKENISQILSADVVLANIDSTDSYNDPGTMYEIGYAMANNIPVIGYTRNQENISERFKGILDGFECVVLTIQEAEEMLTVLHRNREVSASIEDKESVSKQKVLFVGSGVEEVDKKLATCIMDSGANIRWVNEIHDSIYSRIDEIFADVKYMIAVVDDRKTIVSWMIGQAYARNIPIITYSDHNYGVNVMLLVSILTHIRGTEELTQFLQQVKRGGLESIPKFDISNLDSM